MQNILLLIFDLSCLPITFIRLVLIYLFGSRYNIPSLQFLDVMMHATHKFFNQGYHDITIDTIPIDVRLSINHASRVNSELLNENNKQIVNKEDIIFGHKNKIILYTEDNIQKEDIDKLQNLLPKILKQLSSMDENSDTMDISNIDKLLNKEIMNELDFISLNE